MWVKEIHKNETLCALLVFILIIMMKITATNTNAKVHLQTYTNKFFGLLSALSTFSTSRRSSVVDENF